MRLGVVGQSSAVEAAADTVPKANRGTAVAAAGTALEVDIVGIAAVAAVAVPSARNAC